MSKKYKDLKTKKNSNNIIMTDKNKNTETICEELEQINSNMECLLRTLDIISKIKVGNKIIVNDDQIQIDNRYFKSVRRWYTNDNRYLSIIFLENTMTEALRVENVLETQLKKFKPNTLTHKKISNNLNKISVAINDVLTGLSNIRTTYKHDGMIAIRLKKLITNVDDDFPISPKSADEEASESKEESDDNKKKQD